MKTICMIVPRPPLDLSSFFKFVYITGFAMIFEERCCFVSLCNAERMPTADVLSIQDI